MAHKDIEIAVVGGGIGGLAAAISLLQAGFDVHVFEQSRVMREVGAGLQVSPNASRVLHRLGLADELAKLGVRPFAFHQRRWKDGRTLLKTPLANAVVEAFGYPHYQSHRGDILSMLVAALPSDRLHTGHRLTDFADRGDRIEAEFENGSRIATKALIGADGIHSTVCHLLFGAGQPRFTGCVAYRGLIPAERVKHLDIEVTAQLWLGPGKHIIVYYVAGKRLVNFVANIEQASWTRESWTDRGSVSDLQTGFADWDPKLRAIIDAIDETFIWGLFDRAPLQRWSVGRVTLLGDSCHPMLPYIAQGAAQALEDGATLTACLKKYSDVVEALQRYEALRLQRATHIQGMATANKTRFHLRDGPAQRERDAKMAEGGTDWSIKAIAWIYGYDSAAAVETGNLGLPPWAN
jgi:2-polyprenyl-6-methoxyphenol hydroxylase-like FAD-dependent oxidoreductase